MAIVILAILCVVFLTTTVIMLMLKYHEKNTSDVQANEKKSSESDVQADGGKDHTKVGGYIRTVFDSTPHFQFIFMVHNYDYRWMYYLHHLMKVKYDL